MTSTDANSPKKTLCLVTNELYPLSAGGIGRLMYNFAIQNRDTGGPVNLHILVPAELLRENDNQRKVDEAYGDLAQIHIAPDLNQSQTVINTLMHRGLLNKWSFEAQYAIGFRYYLGLLEAEKNIGRSLTYVEFPDFGGWATATIEAQRAGIAFQNTAITARLHSTQGVIRREERFSHGPNLWHGVQLDAERHFLSHAQLVVGHVPGIIDYNAEHYGLADAWAGRTRLEFPPILLDDSVASETAKQTVQDVRADLASGFGLKNPSNLDPDFVFSSRFQQFKRPELFVRAAIVMLDNRPEYTGTFRLISYGWDEDYLEWLQSLVPPIYRKRILFQLDTPPDVREQFIRTSIVVVPSIYESLCLFAFEAATMGCKVILNRQCVGFSTSERWDENENCLMFDGSAFDLAETMGKALSWERSHMVNAEAGCPYWAEPELQIEGRPGSDDGTPSLCLVCYGYLTKAQVLAHAAQLSHVQTDGYDVVFFLPKAFFAQDTELLSHLYSFGWSVELMAGYGDQAYEFGLLISRQDADLIAFLPSGYELHPNYLPKAQTTFSRNPDVMLVGGHIRVVDGPTGEPDTARLYAGNMPSVAMSSSRIAPRTSVVRRTAIEQRPFASEAGEQWFEAWSRDMAIDGVPMLILPELTADLIAQEERVENTKPLSAAIVDRMFRNAGLPARGLAVATGVPTEQDERPTGDLTEDDLTAFQCRLPRGRIRDFPLVSWQPHKEAVLVHPTNDTPTVAELALAGRPVQLVEATVINDKAQNTGIEVAIALVPPQVTDHDIADLLRGQYRYSDAVLSAWSLLEPGDRTTISVATKHVSYGNESVLVITKVPANGDERHAHLLVEKIALHPTSSEL
ncbi:MAG: hypothetical protein AAFO72_11925 [Pseudomonadota bacterium]